MLSQRGTSLEGKDHPGPRLSPLATVTLSALGQPATRRTLPTQQPPQAAGRRCASSQGPLFPRLAQGAGKGLVGGLRGGIPQFALGGKGLALASRARDQSRSDLDSGLSRLRLRRQQSRNHLGEGAGQPLTQHPCWGRSSAVSVVTAHRPEPEQSAAPPPQRCVPGFELAAWLPQSGSHRSESLAFLEVITLLRGDANCLGHNAELMVRLGHRNTMFSLIQWEHSRPFLGCLKI